MMNTKIKNRLLCLFSIIVFLSITGWGPFYSLLSDNPNTELLGSQAVWLNSTIRTITAQASNLDANVLKLSLKAYLKARQQGLDRKQLLTVIDYSKPSTERRMWVIDLKKVSVIYNTWVSHGKNSGKVYATSFSNQPGSLQSSFGVFLTEASYMGGNGYSLHLIGLERGINDNAYRRDIVIHGAWYVDPDVAKKYGQIGRSWGCPAVTEHLARPLIDTIKDKTIVFAYYPDKHWLRHSPYLMG